MRLLVLVAAGERGYVAAAPALPGCSAEGETRAQALANLRRLVSEHGPWRDGAKRFLLGVLKQNGLGAVVRSELIDVALSSPSRIVQRNGGVVRCVRYRGMAGLFRKDDAMPWRFGRALCDRVRREFDCGGFFTTDELPRYGIAESDLATIRTATGATTSDCVMLYAYPRERAQSIDDYLYAQLVELGARPTEAWRGP